MGMPTIQDLYKVMASKGITVPNNINSPTDIINYLLQTGKISQEQYNAAYAQARNFYPGIQNGGPQR